MNTYAKTELKHTKKVYAYQKENCQGMGNMRGFAQMDVTAMNRGVQVIKSYQSTKLANPPTNKIMHTKQYANSNVKT